MSKSKDHNAQALNKKRNAKLSPKRRADIARHASKVRWAKKGESGPPKVA